MHSLIGNSVRGPTPLLEPHGAMLSVSADHGLSVGHMKAAGPMGGYAVVLSAATRSTARSTALFEKCIALACVSRVWRVFGEICSELCLRARFVEGVGSRWQVPFISMLPAKMRRTMSMSMPLAQVQLTPAISGIAV